MHIERLQIKNFKVLRDVDIRRIPRFCVLVGKNGSGKSTLFNVFGFLREALTSNVHTALGKLGGSRGFAEVRSRGADGNIEICIKFRRHGKNVKEKNPLITYLLRIGEEKGRAVVVREYLEYQRVKYGRPWRFLDFKNGAGQAVTNEGLDSVKEERDLEREEQKLKAKDILAIKGLAQFEKFPAAVALGALIEKWHLSDIHINEMQGEYQATLAEHLSPEGRNLSSVIDYLHANHPATLKTITERLHERVPGISEVTPETIQTGQILLKIKDESFNEPFLVRHVSDGTIKMLAYLVLLHDPDPHPLLCVEEPENQLYHHLLAELAEEFRGYANRGGSGQVFVSTHSPDFLNAVEIDEVFWVVKGEDGYSTITPASQDKQLRGYMKKGEKMGYLWKEGFFFNTSGK